MTALALAPPFPIALPAPPWARWRVALAYRWRHGRWPDLDAPARFTEWVQWRKLNDRRQQLALLTDKAHAKSIAEARLAPEQSIPTLWLGEQLPDVAPWPMPFIVKANHGCGQFVVVRNGDDYEAAKAAAPRWLARAYGGWLDEWHYGAARRLVLVEPYIGGADLPLDYKVYVFGGRAALVQVHSERGARHRWSQYDLDWQPLSNDPIAVDAPDCLPAMIAAAEAMGEGETFVRVDFYCEGGALKFGEFCLYPGSGLDPFTPDQLDVDLGALWSRSA